MLGALDLFGPAPRRAHQSYHGLQLDWEAMQRTCQLALRQGNTVPLCARGPRRAFSHSHPRARSALPVYLESSAPELSTLLATANAKLLLPYHLNKEQRKLVYSRANQARLEADPVDITVGQITLPLEHLDRNYLPNRRRTFKDIVRGSQSKNDWENILKLLEGFSDAGIAVKPEWCEQVARCLLRSGHQNLLLKAIQRPQATGFRLSNRSLVLQLVRSIHEAAVEADWAAEPTTRALRLAKQIVELMDNKEHCGRYRNKPTTTSGEVGDWRGSPIVVALPTEIAAKLAEKHGGKQEEVARLANRLVNAMKQSDCMNEFGAMVERASKTEADFHNGALHMNHVRALYEDMMHCIVVWSALKTSRNVLGTTMPLADEARAVEQQLDQVLRQACQSLTTLGARNGHDLGNFLFPFVRTSLEKC